MAARPKPWERQPEETDKAFQAFCKYRDQEPHERSAATIARDGPAMGYKTRLNVLKKWSAKHGWRRRAGAWDNELDRQHRLMVIAERRRRDRDLIRAGRVGREKLLARVEQETLAEVAVDKLAGEMAKFDDLSARGMGIAGKSERVEMTGPNGKPLDSDDVPADGFRIVRPGADPEFEDGG